MTRQQWIIAVVLVAVVLIGNMGGLWLAGAL